MATEKKDLDVKTSVKRVSTDKKNEYASDSAKIQSSMDQKKEDVAKLRAENAAKKAAEEKAAAERKAAKEAEQKRIAEEKAKAQNNKEELEGLANNVIKMATSGKTGKGFFGGLLVGFAIGCLVMMFIAPSLGLFSQVEEVKNDVDDVITETFMGYTALDFKNAILTSQKAREDLEVLEQGIIVPTTITKAGFGNLAIFSKVKECEFAGSGVYTVNMGNIDYDHIEYDEEKGVVTVYIPHAELTHVIMNEKETTFQDTEKGMLAFGDLALTAEQYNTITASVKNVMEEELMKQDLLDLADSYALKKVWQIFNPLVETVTKDVVLEVEFIR